MDYKKAEFTLSTNVVAIPFSQLEIKTETVISAMGYDTNTKKNAPAILYEEIEKLLSELDSHLKIKAGYKIFSPTEIELTKTEIIAGGKIFNSGKIINGQIKQAESLLVFVCTLGKEYDDWMKKIKSTNDMFTIYVADTLGSELIELAIDWLEMNIKSLLKKMDYRHSNRFSPGYCGWPLMDQHKLFSFLPKNICGVHLHDSALMTPIKSVSGIYGLGKSITKKAYQCSICDKTDCYKRYHQAL